MRGSGLVAREPPGHAFVKIALFPAPDGGLGCICAAHDLVGVTTVCRREDYLGSQGDLARRTSVGEQSLKLLTVSGAEV